MHLILHLPKKKNIFEKFSYNLSFWTFWSPKNALKSSPFVVTGPEEAGHETNNRMHTGQWNGIHAMTEKFSGKNQNFLATSIFHYYPLAWRDLLRTPPIPIRPEIRGVGNFFSSHSLLVNLRSRFHFQVLYAHLLDFSVTFYILVCYLLEFICHGSSDFCLFDWLLGQKIRESFTY